MKTKSIVFTAQNKVEFCEQELPALKNREILVKTKKTMISTGTELSVLTRDGITQECTWTECGAYPYYPGYNNVGEVIAVANKKDEHLVGTLIGNILPHTQYGIIENAKEIRPINVGIDTDSALFSSFAEIVLQGVRRGRSTWGESAVVYGAGLLGQLTADFLRIAGVFPIIVCDTSDERLALLTKSPQIIPVNPTKQNVEEIVREATNGRMADVVYELTGVAQLIPQEMKLLHDLGRMVILSSPRGNTTMDFHDLVNRPSCEIIGAHCFHHAPVETFNNQWTQLRDAEIFRNYVKFGILDVKRLISHRVNYTKAPEMYELLTHERSKAMGVILDW